MNEIRNMAEMALQASGNISKAEMAEFAKEAIQASEVTEEKEFAQGEESICYDCMRSRDNCPDCCDGDLYRSPDSYESYERDR